MLAHPNDAAALAASGAAMAQALVASADAYRVAERSPGSGQFSPYQALNRLALEALTPESPQAPRDAAIEVARQCALAAARTFAASFDPWDEVMQPEALLVERMLDTTLAAPGAAGAAVIAELAAAYDTSFRHVTVKPPQIDSIVSQMELLSRFADALALAEADGARRNLLRGLANRLLELVQHVQPGRKPRGDRPPAAAAALKPPAAAPAAKAASKAPVKAVAKAAAKGPGKTAGKRPATRKPRT